MALHLFLTILPSLSLEQGRAEPLVSGTLEMEFWTESYPRGDGSDICT